MARVINLDVNDSGAWRRVASFDLDEFEGGQLEHVVDVLLGMATNEKLKARLIIPGDTAPLMTWTRQGGWEEWRAAA